ncbi:BON domain-containing protein [Telluribacter sp. SYSU D00476]|uniref:BON domain-containing protein n=1 Tax=Telluribacter sp. SYSU D00476 TaxID=2811430 RepID=UPI001FF48684|nr:BON domain-containing protein [Telluribacter sp. SYSU D00476]
MKFKTNISVPLAFCICLLSFLSGCRPSDADLKADFIAKAEREKDFQGVSFVVEEGIVTINGVCPSEKSKKKVEETVKGVHGVKDIVSHITIAPVTIGTDHNLKTSVDSVLKKYPAVEASVADSIVTLSGKAQDNKKSEELLTAIKSLQPRSIIYQVTTAQ